MNLKAAQISAANAARAAGRLIRANLNLAKRVNLRSSHDIKLELDVRCQALIENRLRAPFPEVAVLGEEGVSGAVDAEYRWVIDPIDGTVNFAYGIPHACVSIALQGRGESRPAKKAGGNGAPRDGYVTLVGVVFDPFMNELWTGIRGQPARLNGRLIRVSRRNKLSEAIVSIGFAKSRDNLMKTLPYFNELAPRIRKIRMMGAAALALAYVASGRFDVYIERGISLWDIAAGGLILECAGGEFFHEPVPGEHKYRMAATNGRLRRQLRLGELFA